jgi:hypothetical protein
MKIDLPDMNFDIPSIPDPHFEPKINYKAVFKDAFCDLEACSSARVGRDNMISM